MQDIRSHRRLVARSASRTSGRQAVLHGRRRRARPRAMDERRRDSTELVEDMRHDGTAEPLIPLRARGRRRHALLRGRRRRRRAPSCGRAGRRSGCTTSSLPTSNLSADSLTGVGATLFLVANNGAGLEVWRAPATVETQLVADIKSTGGSSPRSGSRTSAARCTSWPTTARRAASCGRATDAAPPWSRTSPRTLWC